ncbi:MAG TPA: hypothetical protein VJ724_15735 [Tahibacter sp.]|nr:hypothetical protein [Tahibacter sp.]
MHNHTSAIATDAAYWHAALSAGVHDVDDAKDWAFDLIARDDAPDIRIIDVATAQGRDAVVATLSALTAGADVKEAAARLFGVVRARLVDDALTVEAAAAMSARICNVLALPLETRLAFDRIERLLEQSGDDLETNRPAIARMLRVTLETPYA